MRRVFQMKSQRRKLDLIDKILLVISLILLILNLLFIFNLVQVHNGVSTLVLSATMLVLGFVTFKKQSNKIGYMYFVVAIFLLIVSLITFI
ncbi:DUF3953 domain-containing protein [Staphylococcus caeli]|uniref:DUF3953 domain-containing protein n=1 Tax=Staphylococcus caeli TaxID=2201815 RepID=A0A1D4PH30_9STAP|nr:DUF3953 domain-containing protein [Staphylococcus caeli]SCT00364.1 Uncharacterised protein [Staphylococcus caeli]SCT22229.1 Uncharacterised protein [Staphylococcus caeli]